LLMPPAEWTTFPAGGYRLPRSAATRLARLGLKTGWPDILIVHRGVFGIELKTEVGRLSKTRISRFGRSGVRLIVGQADMHVRLRAAGMPVAVCRSLEDVLAALRGWEIPLRGAAVQG